jgi:hypothetical protein
VRGGKTTRGGCGERKRFGFAFRNRNAKPVVVATPRASDIPLTQPKFQYTVR